MFTAVTADALRRFRALYAALAEDAPHSILLDSCGWTGKTGGLYVMGFQAKAMLRLKEGRLTHWQAGNETLSGPIQTPDDLAQALTPYLPPVQLQTDLAFKNAWFGVLSYELNHTLEPSVTAQACENPMGDLYWVQFEHLIVWTPPVCQVISTDTHWKRRVEALLETPSIKEQSTFQSLSDRHANASLSRAEFEAHVNTIQDHIRCGNVYQANLSMRFDVPDISAHSLWPLYQALVERNPSPFSAVFATPEGTIISNSPERLVKFATKTNQLETRPIAGTRGRGQTAEQTQAIDETLLTDPKEQAEHAMLVDLERNDLGRVAVAGSVTVPELGVLEQYSHVTHLVSQVEATRRSDARVWQILGAMFPGGTITGCPKVRCMQILADLEPVPRGFYTGSLGYIDGHGNLDFNILIRSLFYTPDRHLHYHVGAGIVADSVAAWEYRECQRKAAVIEGVLYGEHHPHSA